MKTTISRLLQPLRRELEFVKCRRKYHGVPWFAVLDSEEILAKCDWSLTSTATAKGRQERIDSLIRVINAGVRRWNRTSLSFDEQTHERQKPLLYYKLQIELLRQIEGKCLVEVGSARAPLRHPIDEFNPVCCNDGHSTHHWAAADDLKVSTVDISPRSKEVLDAYHYGTLRAFTADGVEFLRSWNGDSIDFLFLDAWDVGVKEYAEMHVRAYEAARCHLSQHHMLGIDDTDFVGDGKGKLLIPHLLGLGYRVIVAGRQTVLMNA